MKFCLSKIQLFCKKVLLLLTFCFEILWFLHFNGICFLADFLSKFYASRKSTFNFFTYLHIYVYYNCDIWVLLWNNGICLTLLKYFLENHILSISQNVAEYRRRMTWCTENYLKILIIPFIQQFVNYLRPLRIMPSR